MKAASEIGAWVKDLMSGEDVGRKNSISSKKFGRGFHEWNDGEGRARSFGRAMDGWSDGELPSGD